MTIESWLWATTFLALVGVLALDFAIVGRRPHEPSLRESTAWVVLYIGLAVAFGVWVWARWGGGYAGEFFAGWLTEYSLSADNLFVFVIIMSRFNVPREHQQRILMVGIVLALVLRGVFIAAGAAAVQRFAWVFYLFGAFLLYTAWKLVRHGEDDKSDFNENAMIRWTRRILPLAPNYDTGGLTSTVDGRRVFTPVLLVMVAIGTTDLAFAVDSIPAIFGLTQEPYLVFTANVFALMGLRQLYFMLGGLLDRLTYLSVGLAFVLGFIGVKLVLEALHTNNVPFINGGQPLSWAPEIPVWLSLSCIIGILTVASLASVVSSWRQSRRGEAGETTRITT